MTFLLSRDGELVVRDLASGSRACVVNGRLAQDRAGLGGRWPGDPLHRRRTGRRRSQRRVLDGRLVGARAPHRAARLQIERPRRSQRTRARLHGRGSVAVSTGRRTGGGAGRTRRRRSWRRRGRRGRWRCGRRPESVRRRRARRRRRNAATFAVVDLAAKTTRTIAGQAATMSADGSTIAWLNRDGGNCVLTTAPGAQRRTDHGAHRDAAGRPALSPDGSARRLRTDAAHRLGDLRLGSARPSGGSRTKSSTICCRAF